MNLGQLEQLIAEIRQVSFTDDKTSLGNALALEEEERAINEGQGEFEIIVFGDLNDFKHLNDIHTHDAGDVAIREAGEAIRKLVVKDLSAKAFRQSGDEFVILLKQDAAERFISTAAALGSIKFVYNEIELATAMSFGYVYSDGKTSFRDLLTRAETACQYAKTKGDGKCVEWIEDMKRNPLIRIGGRCLNCNAKISCNVPKQNAPATLSYCPCCGSTDLA
jgi:diguanylate cyclase (GGDEF)-like protein